MEARFVLLNKGCTMCDTLGAYQREICLVSFSQQFFCQTAKIRIANQPRQKYKKIIFITNIAKMR